MAAASKATLVCLLPDSREPLMIPIQFDEHAGPVTLHVGPNRPLGLWIECSSTDLLIGAPGLPGVWTLPKSEIETEIQRQLAARPPDSQPGQTAEERKRAVLAKYDSNHNGQIDSDERELAISDPAFLESEIDNIDLNETDSWIRKNLVILTPTKTISSISRSWRAFTRFSTSWQ